MRTLFSRKRAFFTLGLLIVLAACGGSTSVDVDGTITGLTTDGMKLKNNGGEPLTIGATDKKYTFPNQIGSYDSYSVTVFQQPTQGSVWTGSTPPPNPCFVLNATGQASGVSITNANVACAYNLKITVSGLGGSITSGLGLTVTGMTASWSTPLSATTSVPGYINGAITPPSIAVNETDAIVTQVLSGTAVTIAVTTNPVPAQSCTIFSYGSPPNLTLPGTLAIAVAMPVASDLSVVIKCQ